MEIAAGLRLAIPVFEEPEPLAGRRFSGAVALRAKLRPTAWLALEVGGGLALEESAFGDGTLYAVGDVPVALTGQIGDHVAVGLASGLRLRDATFLEDRAGVVGPDFATELTAFVPLAFQIEVALGGDHAWGVIGLSVAFPELVSSGGETVFLAEERRRHGLWLGVFL